MLPVQVAASVTALTGKDVVAVHRLSGGSRSPSWQVVTPQAKYAVRCYLDPQPAHTQARLLRHLGQSGIPVPEVVSVGNHASQHVLVLSWVAGTTIVDALSAQPEQAHRLGIVFGRVQAQLHALPLTPDMRSDLRFVGVHQQDAAVSLLHIDYHLNNVMTDGRTITGVIDWENVRLGDARYDLARTLSILCSDPSIRVLPRAQRGIIRHFRQGYLAGYRESETAPVSPLAPFLAWAGRFMLADLSHRLVPSDANAIRRWADRWATYAGQSSK